MSGIPLRIAAKALGIDASTLWRDVQAGCPVVAKGRRGPGASTLVNLEEVRAWRGQLVAAPDPDVILQQIAAALLASLQEDHCDIRTGCERDDAIALLLKVWERMCRTFGKAFDQQPKPIFALTQELYVTSDERSHGTRR
jgi:hypothetical protein